MKHPFFRGLALLAALGFSGCVYTNISIPLDTDLQDTDLGTKTGESMAQSFLGLIAWGDASTEAAAADGDISTLKHADQRVFSILGPLYYRQTTVVYGD